MLEVVLPWFNLGNSASFIGHSQKRCGRWLTGAATPGRPTTGTTTLLQTQSWPDAGETDKCRAHLGGVSTQWKVRPRPTATELPGLGFALKEFAIKGSGRWWY